MNFSFVQIQSSKEHNSGFLLTSGESKGYLGENLNCSVKCSPSYNVPSAPVILIVHLKKTKIYFKNTFLL